MHALFDSLPLWCGNLSAFARMNYADYVSEPRRDDDLKAVGPFIQACLEIKHLN